MGDLFGQRFVLGRLHLSRSFGRMTAIGTQAIDAAKFPILFAERASLR